MTRNLIHVCIGTKAQYIKTAPLLLRMDAEGVEYRLIDMGQHGSYSKELRADLRVRDPDTFVGGGTDIVSIPQALGWAARLCSLLLRPKKLRVHVFGGSGGICVVHGDTPSTLLSTWFAKVAGLKVAHLEAGLRSESLFHPFPEELIRRVVMRQSDFLFAPSEESVETLRRLRTKGEVVFTAGNSIIEMVARKAQHSVSERATAVVTCHRVENLHRRRRLEQLVDLVSDLANQYEVWFITHPPTERVLERQGLLEILQRQVKVSGLLAHDEFVDLLSGAALVVTDGGSVQEECALLGVPTLLWRAQTERTDGLGSNVVLSRYKPDVIDGFIRDPDRYRSAGGIPPTRPTQIVLETLQDRLASLVPDF